MSVSKSFVFLTAMGAVVTLLAWRLGGSYIAMFLFWNVLLLGMLLLDLIITPGKKFLKITRGENDVLYFKAENEIDFTVENASRHALQITAKNGKNRHLVVFDESLPSQWIPGLEGNRFTYVVQPNKRGSFAVENVYLRYPGLLGLCQRHVKIPCPIEFKVYPNVRDLSKFRLMLQKSRLLPRGEKVIKNYGMGYEFESLRPYVDGDDYRKINWRATARENKLIVSKYQIERNQPVFILLDVGRPMSYSVKGYKKLDFAINAAIILADIVNQSGDKAGLMVFDSQVRNFVSAGQGAAHRNLLMETLYHVQDNRQTSDYGGAFRALCDKQKRRSLVFIFTDFELPEEAREMISYMAFLKRRHLPIVVFMENESLQFLTETEVKNRYDKYLKFTAQEFAAERKGIFRNLSAMGIPNVESKAEDFAVNAVNRYIQLTQ
jgi:uncharacterized protein (DUF58 family)